MGTRRGILAVHSYELERTMALGGRAPGAEGRQGVSGRLARGERRNRGLVGEGWGDTQALKGARENVAPEEVGQSNGRG